MKKTMYFFVKTLRDYLKEECLGLFFSIIYTITVFLSPQISKFIVDEVLVNHHFQDIGMAFFSFFLICIIQTASAYIKNRIFFKVSEKITFSMRNKMLQSLIHTHMEFFDTTPKGFIFSRFFNDSKSISDFITNIFVTFIKNSLLIIAVTYGMFMLSWKITSLVFILLSLYILLNIFSSKKFKEFSRISLHKNDSLYKNFIQSVDNAFLTRIFSLHHYYFEKVQKNLKDIFAMNIKINNFSNLINSCSNIMIVISLSIIYGYGAFLSIIDEVSVGDIVALGVYFQMLLGPISEMMNSNTVFQEIIPIAKRIEEYLHLKSELTENKSEEDLNITSPLSIVFNKVSFDRHSQNEDICVLKNINFVFEGNGVFGLFGSSGCGKTTILKLLMGLYLPTEGKISIVSEKNKKRCDPCEVRQKISYVSQNFELINASVFDNLTLFDSSITKKEVIEVCESLHLHAKIMSLKDNYESVIDENINLSEGEKQRVCIARAILRKSFIYIFDEPTAFLDENSQFQVQHVIEKLAQRSIVIIVSHDPYMFKGSKKIIVINNGEVVQECDDSGLLIHTNKKRLLNYE